MADISKCPGKGCSKKNTCYRFLAKDDKFAQAYFATPPVGINGHCEYYWKHEERTKDESAKRVVNRRRRVAKNK